MGLQKYFAGFLDKSPSKLEEKYEKMQESKNEDILSQSSSPFINF
jgi:hypothetical protein